MDTAQAAAAFLVVTAWEPQPGRYVGPDFTSFTAISAEGIADRCDAMARGDRGGQEARLTPDWSRIEVVPPARWTALPNGRPRLFMEAPAGLAAEAAPISMGTGWRTVRLTGERKGQKRTFSKQKEEWLTVYPGKVAA